MLMNAVGFFLCRKDKQAARKDRWRVPEKNFFLLGLLWGATGIYAAMLLFHHKTKHWYFMAGMPVLMLINYGTLYKLIQIVGG